jgi:hypothetical protein
MTRISGTEFKSHSHTPAKSFGLEMRIMRTSADWFADDAFWREGLRCESVLRAMVEQRHHSSASDSGI